METQTNKINFKKMFSASMSSRIALDTCYRAGDFSSSTKNAVPLSNLADTVEIDASANPPQKIDFYSFQLCK
jgi:hypothetical protein